MEGIYMSQALSDDADYVIASHNVVYALDGIDRIFAGNFGVNLLYGGQGADFLAQQTSGAQLDGYGGPDMTIYTAIR
jgi:hypothetical protein